MSIAESVRTQSAVSLANRFLCMPLPHKLSIGRASAGALGHPFQVTYGGSFRRAAAAAYLLPRKHHAVQFGEVPPVPLACEMACILRLLCCQACTQGPCQAGRLL